MTFGTMNHINKQYKTALLIFSFFISFPALALDVKKADIDISDLPKLLQIFSEKKQNKVDFKEEKHAFYLDEPIVSSGHLEFYAPNKLNKFIIAPEKVSQKIQGDTLTVNDGNKTHVVDLNDHPEFSIILRSIIHVLSGNHAALIKDFKIKFESKPSGWTLSLRPHDSFTASHVDSIQMFGEKNIFLKMIVKEPNNDYTLTTLYNHR